MLVRYMCRDRIEAFRAMMRYTRAVLSGSSVLHFAIRDDHWQPADLDIYAPFGTGFNVVSWLVKREGYEVASDGLKSFTRRPKTTIRRTEGPYDWTTPFELEAVWIPSPPRNQTAIETPTQNFIFRVIKLRKPSSPHSIDIIESSKPSFLPPITRFHSSLVMNYITADSLVILYPSLTLRRIGILHSRNSHLSEYDENGAEEGAEEADEVESIAEVQEGLSLPVTARTQYVIEKYQRRRFTLYASPADRHRPCGAACPSLVREDGDPWSLTLEFSKEPRLPESTGAHWPAPNAGGSDPESVHISPAGITPSAETASTASVPTIVGEAEVPSDPSVAAITSPESPPNPGPSYVAEASPSPSDYGTAETPSAAEGSPVSAHSSLIAGSSPLIVSIPSSPQSSDPQGPSILSHPSPDDAGPLQPCPATVVPPADSGASRPMTDYELSLRPRLPRTMWKLLSVVPRAVTAPAERRRIARRRACANPSCPFFRWPSVYAQVYREMGEHDVAGLFSDSYED
ncbi:hypothetical protein HGRIS_012182 [Hohenbuehelia grisea]|uniref:Uncharacterized protein n=1 Tax=Hohenbuehelia grisea TaxID=104357 RepID=A0ABR3IRI8_9AGAR